jgi:hypothetical protein
MKLLYCIIILIIILAIRFFIKKERRNNKKSQLFYTTNEFYILKINWRLISQECISIIKSMTHNYNNKEKYFDIINNRSLILNTLNICPNTIKLLAKIPNIIYAGFNILEVGSIIKEKKYKDCLMYFLCLNVSSDNQSGIFINNFNYVFNNSNDIIVNTNYNLIKYNISKYDSAILLLILDKSNNLSYN